MTSKNISITEEVYNKLMKIKRDNESFSELFLRLLRIQKDNMEKCFGAWRLSEEEKNEIWDNIANRPGRNWKKSRLGDINDNS
ncbi:MAG: antitoxin VapB family protein [Promethearchaeota archaeon]